MGRPMDSPSAVITGAASGIGKACALKFAQSGFRVALLDVDEAALAAVERELVDGGSEALARRTDVSRAADCDERGG